MPDSCELVPINYSVILSPNASLNQSPLYTFFMLTLPYQFYPFVISCLMYNVSVSVLYCIMQANFPLNISIL